MRKERLRREQEEHERERKLLASIRGENNNEATTDLTHDAYRYSLIIFFLVNFIVYIQLQVTSSLADRVYNKILDHDCFSVHLFAT